METTGLKLIDVLRRAWIHPFKTQSDFARENANFVAMAASDGLITTKVATGLYGDRWLITDIGINHIMRFSDE